MNLIKPNITPGDWRAQARSASDGSLVIKGDKESDYDEIACLRPKADRCYGPQEERDLANAAALAALPGLLAALEKAWERACVEAIRDEYKTALELAGYSFDV